MGAAAAALAAAAATTATTTVTTAAVVLAAAAADEQCHCGKLSERDGGWKGGVCVRSEAAQVQPRG